MQTVRTFLRVLLLSLPFLSVWTAVASCGPEPCQPPSFWYSQARKCLGAGLVAPVNEAGADGALDAGAD